MGSVPQTGIGTRELLWCPPPVRSPNMDNLATSLMELWNTPGVAEKVEETARVYFANSILTINLIPALLVGALLLFLLPPLLGFPILNGLLHHPTVPRSLLMEHQNLPTELQHPPMTPRQPQTATTPQRQTATTLQSQTATTHRQADTTQAGESVLWSFQLKQRISTLTSTLMSNPLT